MKILVFQIVTPEIEDFICAVISSGGSILTIAYIGGLPSRHLAYVTDIDLTSKLIVPFLPLKKHILI